MNPVCVWLCFNCAVTMPGLIAVSEFVEETREDYSSPTTSTFVSRMPQCRQTVGSLEEVSCWVAWRREWGPPVESNELIGMDCRIQVLSLYTYLLKWESTEYYSTGFRGIAFLSATVANQGNSQANRWCQIYCDPIIMSRLTNEFARSEWMISCNDSLATVVINPLLPYTIW